MLARVRTFGLRRGAQSLAVSLALLSCDVPFDTSASIDEAEEDAGREAVIAPATPTNDEAAALLARREAPRGTQSAPTPARDESAGVAPATSAVTPPPDPEAELRAARLRERADFDRTWPLFGVCYHYLAHVRARPDGASPIIGYMRRGAQFRAKAGVRGPGCDRTWHEVVGGGYVCRGTGYQLGDREQTFDGSPVAPALDASMPYAYASVGRADAPQYWRAPRPSEVADGERIMAQLREQARVAALAVSASAPAAEGESGPDPSPEAPPQLQSAEAPPSSALPSFFRMRMQRGFYVSVDREELVDGVRYFRTIRGAYVPADAMTVVTPPAMRGVVLGGRWQPPLGFVYRQGAQSFARDPATGALRAASVLDFHAPLLLQEETLDRGGNPYRITRAGAVVRESNLRLIEPIARPRGIGPNDKWIHVALARQTLVAYEGDRPVFATLVSSGRAGFETPTGTFRIQSKHVSATMDDTSSANEAYSIEDVPWTMYYDGSFALHAAIWHDRFGRPRSHGCVNLAPADARWLFQWTAPVLPPGWHGVVAGAGRPGTFVHVTD